MNPLWAARLLHPTPSLFGLVNDVGLLILREHLELPQGVLNYEPAALVTLISLRLVNRETCFFLEQWGYPSLGRLPVPRSSDLTTRAWFECVSTAALVALTNRPLLRVTEAAFWSRFNRKRLVAVGTRAIMEKKSFLVKQLMARLEDDVPKAFFIAAIKEDNVAVYARYQGDPNYRRKAHSRVCRKLAKYDAEQCVRYELSRSLSSNDRKNLCRNLDRAMALHPAPRVRHHIMVPLLSKKRKRPRSPPADAVDPPAKKPRFTLRNGKNFRPFCDGAGE